MFEYRYFYFSCGLFCGLFGVLGVLQGQCSWGRGHCGPYGHRGGRQGGNCRGQVYGHLVIFYGGYVSCMKGGSNGGNWRHHGQTRGGGSRQQALFRYFFNFFVTIFAHLRVTLFVEDIRNNEARGVGFGLVSFLIWVLNLVFVGIGFFLHIHRRGAIFLYNSSDTLRHPFQNLWRTRGP